MFCLTKSLDCFYKCLIKKFSLEDWKSIVSDNVLFKVYFPFFALVFINGGRHLDHRLHSPLPLRPVREN